MLEITSPITKKRFQIAPDDFITAMTWEEAINACDELGTGWRLPSIKELEIIYKELHKKGEGNFKKVIYWSSTVYEDDIIRYFCFNDGIDGFYEKYNTYYVRAVRAL